MHALNTTAFHSATAVDAWDKWFRWRCDGRLRDVTIGDTWRRVSKALAENSPLNGDYWADRYVDAFSQWRLLPNARWLRDAATPQQAHEPQAGCVVNLAGHLVRKRSGYVLDEELLGESASLAVRLVDDLLCTARRSRGHGAEIGVIGLGTAVDRLGEIYGSRGARAFACRSFQLMSRAGWHASASLAQERGPLFGLSKDVRALLVRRGMPHSEIDAIERNGLRFRCISRITLQPALAVVAGVTDALQPGAPGVLGKSGTVASEIKMRACVQPWVDEPIDPPLFARQPLKQEELDYCARLARRLHVHMSFINNDGASLDSNLGDEP